MSKQPSRLKLPNGVRYGHDNEGNRICIGAMMGRRTVLPIDLPADDYDPAPRLHLRRMYLDAGGYDCGGAYWGGPDNLYVASEGFPVPAGVTIYVRAESRTKAKAKVLARVRLATFHR